MKFYGILRNKQETRTLENILKYKHYKRSYSN